ncbi:MAG: hypothetical protein LBR37_03640, partial [Erysipelotrichaceae bacterium]|nr:hypothetical protein [Erysipelotrichaceae bacterium]
MKYPKKKVVYLSFLMIPTLVITGLALGLKSNDSSKTKVTELKTEWMTDLSVPFDPDSLIIVLDNESSLEFKNYELSDFPEFNGVEIQELTTYTSTLVQKQLHAEATGDWSELQAHIDNAMLVDVSNFHRIFSFKLNDFDRSNALMKQRSAKEINDHKVQVLEAAKRLTKHEDILYAGPNYIHQPALTTNDPYYTNGTQWGINHIGLPAAWDLSTGSSSVYVGVIDTGFD